MAIRAAHPSPGPWTDCRPLDGACGTDGQQTRTITTSFCQGGACAGDSSATESMSCIATPPASCMPDAGPADTGPPPDTNPPDTNPSDTGPTDAGGEPDTCETEVEVCDDQIDNDCNGFIDCEDLATCGGDPTCFDGGISLGCEDGGSWDMCQPGFNFCDIACSDSTGLYAIHCSRVSNDCVCDIDAMRIPCASMLVSGACSDCERAVQEGCCFGGTTI